MDVINTELVNQTISEVLEHMAFMFGEPVDAADLPPASDAAVHASVRFSGDRSGVLEFATVRALCPILAANVLGCEPEDELAAQRADDAIRELLNVLCGHLLTAVAGDQPVFDIAPGSVRDAPMSAFEELRDDPAALAFVVEDLPLVLRFRWEETTS